MSKRKPSVEKSPIEQLIDFIHAELKKGESLGHEYPRLENVLLKAEDIRNEFRKIEPKTPLERLGQKLKLIQRPGVDESIWFYYIHDWDLVWRDAVDYEKLYIAMTEQYGAMTERLRIKKKGSNDK